MIDFKDQKVVICGLQGSGKTYLSKKLVKNKKVLVFSPHKHDWTDTQVFYYKCKNYNYDDLEIFLKFAEKLAKKNQIEGIVIDEADMYFRSNYDLKQNLNNWVLNHRHIGAFMILITRRPQDIPTKIFESSKFIISFYTT
jgi:GTPase SAR1 family protein